MRRGASLFAMWFSRLPPTPTPVRQVVSQQPLRRVLTFTRRSIDDVVNDPIAKNEVLGYYKLQCWTARGMEISDLERQWNGS